MFLPIIATKIFRLFHTNMITINPNVKFSYNFTRGTLNSRREFVSRLNEQFFDSFTRLFDGKKVKLSDLKKVYEANLPERKNIDVKKMKAKEFIDGKCDYKYSDMGYGTDIIGLTLELPIKNSKVNPTDLPTIMHENTHILSALSIPKVMALVQKMTKQNQYTNAYSNWFMNTFYCFEDFDENYTPMDMVKKVIDNTNKFLKGKTYKEKIQYLQDVRYQLQEEIHAFEEQNKFALKLKEKGCPINEEDIQDYEGDFQFTKKLELIKEIMIDIFKKKKQKNFEKYGWKQNAYKL